MEKVQKCEVQEQKIYIYIYIYIYVCVCACVRACVEIGERCV
jgi:hypothetical protein